MTRDHFQPTPETAPEPIRPAFYLNFVFLVVVGVGASAWMFHFTDWFESALSLLALGGVFSWLALVLKVLPEGVTKAAQDGFYQKFLANPKSLLFVGAAAVLGLVASLCVGTIELTLAEGTADREVKFYGKGSAPPETGSEWVAKGRTRFVFLKWPFVDRDLKVKVAGYPSAAVKLGTWSLKPLRAPHSFVRPVVLLRPTLAFVRLFADPGNLIRGEVTVNGTKYSQIPLSDRAVWVGCDEDVEVPEALQAVWYAQTKPEDHDQVRLSWLRPRSLAAAGGNGPYPDELDPKSTVVVEYTLKDGTKVPPQSTPVGGTKGEFPTVLDIK